MSDDTGTDVEKWADKAMYEAAPMMNTLPKVFLISSTPDPLGAIAAACRMYEGKPTYGLDDIGLEERVHYWEEVNKTHLKAPLEFVQLHFFIEGVTRAFTHQMVRQRTAVYAQESLRFAVKTNMLDETQMPPSIAGLKDDDPKRIIWDMGLIHAEEAYTALVNAGVPAEDARGLLPHAVTTRLNYATNLRNLLDHAGNRLCTQAQFEWRYVFLEIMKVLREHETQPYNMGLDQWAIITDPKYAAFAPVCYAQGKCPFKAGFDRGCTIRERVDAGRFDQINPLEWLTDPRAAWVR